MNSTRIPRPGVRAALQILSGFVLITCLVPDPALAYIDPGTGSFILQGRPSRMTTSMTSSILSSSFRDPSGFLFRADGRLMRQVNQTYADDYNLLKQSGLYDILVRKGLLIPHEEVSLDFAPRPGAYKVLRPVEIPFISYPYEWAFSQLKDAALTTLRIQKLALKKGMTLKDASAYNIQFYQGRPVLIDTLSFTGYQDGSPWIAYGQFCRHFLAPLALMAYRDVRLAALLRTNIDGIPLDLASRLLPTRTRINPGLLMHLHAHAASQKKHEKAGGAAKRPTVSKKNLVGIVDSLRGVVQGLKWKLPVTEWGDYYDNTNYSDDSLLQKKKLVEGLQPPFGIWERTTVSSAGLRVIADCQR